jgi:hypothetical protein
MRTVLRMEASMRMQASMPGSQAILPHLLNHILANDFNSCLPINRRK